MQKLTDNVEYKNKSQRLQELQGERKRLTIRREEIAVKVREMNQQSNTELRAHALLRGENNWADKEALGGQLAQMDNEISAVDVAVDLMRSELNTIHGKVSREICEPIRRDFVPHIRKILAAAREIKKADTELNRLRSALENEGLTTGSIPAALFGIDGRLANYEKWTRENWPEVK